MSIGTAGIQVILRCRPLSEQEQAGSTAGARCLEVLSEHSVHYIGRDAPPSSQFGFDRIVDERCSQEQTFEGLQSTVQAVLQGFNATIMAYGQTGSGKTHTLLGDVGHPSRRGVVPRAVAELARGIAAHPEPCHFKVTLSVIEIYNERIRDLLDPAKDNLQVIHDKERGVVVADATALPVCNEKDCVALMQRGIAARAVSATAMNAGSSRSHCLVYLVVERAFADGRTEFGKLCLVDLAGSERQDKTGAVGLTAAEGSQINRSLSVLGSVVHALTDPRGKQQHVPFRDSKLTRVLQDSLGGTARTVLIICCSPSLFNDAETLSSLRFGCRAKGIQNSVQANAVKRTPEQLAKGLAVAEAEVAALTQRLHQLQAGQGSTGWPASHRTAASAERGPRHTALKWTAVTALQLAGLTAYFVAAAKLGCA